MTKKHNDLYKLCALSAYFFPIGLIWYLIDKDMKKNKFVGFHVHQSVGAAIAYFGLYIITIIITGILNIGFIAGLISFAISILGLVWFIQGIVHSLKEEEKGLIFIEELGKQFKF